MGLTIRCAVDDRKPERRHGYSRVLRTKFLFGKPMFSMEREYFLLSFKPAPFCQLTKLIFAGGESVANANDSRNAKTHGLLYVILFP